MSNREEFLISELDRLLTSCVMDGTEGHVLVDELIIAVRNANGDPFRIRDAGFDAKRRLRALLNGAVPIDAVRDAIIRIAENLP